MPAYCAAQVTRACSIEFSERIMSGCACEPPGGAQRRDEAAHRRKRLRRSSPLRHSPFLVALRKHGLLRPLRCPMPQPDQHRVRMVRRAAWASAAMSVPSRPALDVHRPGGWVEIHRRNARGRRTWPMNSPGDRRRSVIDRTVNLTALSLQAMLLPTPSTETQETAHAQRAAPTSSRPWTG